MTEGQGILLFADEAGLPLALEAVGSIRPIIAVVDPKRDAAVTWAKSHASRFDQLLFHPTKKDRSGFSQTVKRHSPRLGLIVSYSRILWPDLLSHFPLGVVNLHGGKLPQFRGANVLQWAIISNAAATAATLHYVDEGIDSGPVIDQREVSITEQDDALSLRAKLVAQSVLMLREWIPRLYANRVPALHQNEAEAKAWPRRTPGDGEIDWRWDDRRIFNLIRALVPPWPGAFYRNDAGQKIVIREMLTPAQVRILRKEVAVDRRHPSA